MSYTYLYLGEAKFVAVPDDNESSVIIYKEGKIIVPEVPALQYLKFIYYPTETSFEKLPKKFQKYIENLKEEA